MDGVSGQSAQINVVYSHIIQRPQQSKPTTLTVLIICLNQCQCNFVDCKQRLYLSECIFILLLNGSKAPISENILLLFFLGKLLFTTMWSSVLPQAAPTLLEL